MSPLLLLFVLVIVQGPGGCVGARVAVLGRGSEVGGLGSTVTFLIGFCGVQSWFWCILRPQKAPFCICVGHDSFWRDWAKIAAGGGYAVAGGLSPLSSPHLILGTACGREVLADIVSDSWTVLMYIHFTARCTAGSTTGCTTGCRHLYCRLYSWLYCNRLYNWLVKTFWIFILNIEYLNIWSNMPHCLLSTQPPSVTQWHMDLLAGRTSWLACSSATRLGSFA